MQIKFPMITLGGLAALVMLLGITPTLARNIRSESSLVDDAYPRLTLLAPEGPQPAGGVIEVEVQIDNAVDLAAFEFVLVFDTSLVQVNNIVAQPFLGTSSICDPVSERCVITLGPQPQAFGTRVGAFTYGDIPGAVGSGILALLQLHPTGKTGTTDLHLSHALVSDTKGNLTTPDTQSTALVLVTPEAKIYLPLIMK